jgi:hypothetical protein
VLKLEVLKGKLCPLISIAPCKNVVYVAPGRRSMAGVKKRSLPPSAATAFPDTAPAGPTREIALEAPGPRASGELRRNTTRVFTGTCSASAAGKLASILGTPDEECDAGSRESSGDMTANAFELGSYSSAVPTGRP